MSDSAAAVIVHQDGTAVAAKEGDIQDASKPALMVAGQDGYGIARIIETDSEGRPVVVGAGISGSPAGGVVSVQGVPNGQAMPISGTVVGAITAGSITGTLTSNQGLQAQHANRWPVGLSNGTEFVEVEFTSGEILAEQNGANAVLTFTFASPVNEVHVDLIGDGLVGRIDPFGGTPSSTLGIPCYDKITKKLSIVTTTVRIYAPTGATVNVFGFRR